MNERTTFIDTPQEDGSVYLLPTPETHRTSGELVQEPHVWIFMDAPLVASVGICTARPLSRVIRLLLLPELLHVLFEVPDVLAQ